MVSKKKKLSFFPFFSFLPPLFFHQSTQLNSQRRAPRHGDLGPGHVRRVRLAQENESPRDLCWGGRSPHRVVPAERLELLCRERRNDQRRQHGPRVDGVEADAVLGGELGGEGLDEGREGGLGCRYVRIFLCA